MPVARAVETSLYELLEVSVTASREEIEESYHRIVDYLGPNSLATYSMLEEDEGERLRNRLDEAYRTLTDPALRADYDRNRPGERAPAERSAYPTLIVPQGEKSESSSTVGRLRRDNPPPEAAPVSTAPPAPAVAPVSNDPPPAVARAAAPEPAPLAPRLESSLSTDLDKNGDTRHLPPPLPRPLTHQQGDKRRRRLQPHPSIDVGPDTEFSGSLLRRLRESASASLEEVADITKISKRYITALEENDFDTLPAFVYVRGFVCEYARALGLDPKLVAGSYMSLYRRYRGESS